MTTKYIIKSEQPHTHNGQPIVKDGKQLICTTFVVTAKSFTNDPTGAKRFNTIEDAQRYITRNLHSGDGETFSVAEYYIR